MKKVKYKQIQYGIVLNVVTSVSILLLFSAYKQELSTLKSNILLIIIFMLFILWLLFYKLTIIVDNQVVSAIFGIGLLKRKIPLTEIDFSSLQIVKPSLLTGIGVRYTNKGWLWNVKFSNAIYFKTKKGKTFFVGTNDADKIKELLLKSSY